MPSVVTSTPWNANVLRAGTAVDRPDSMKKYGMKKDGLSKGGMSKDGMKKRSMMWGA